MIHGRPEPVEAGRGSLRHTVLLWLGVLGAPVAWAVLLGLGYLLDEAQCSRGSDAWGLDARIGNSALAAAATLVGVASLAAAYATWRSGQRGDVRDERGRFEWMGFSGLLVSSLFLFLILMTGFGVNSVSPCHQA